MRKTTIAKVAAALRIARRGDPSYWQSRWWQEHGSNRRRPMRQTIGSSLSEHQQVFCDGCRSASRQALQRGDIVVRQVRAFR